MSARTSVGNQGKWISGLSCEHEGRAGRALGTVGTLRDLELKQPDPGTDQDF